MSLIDPEEYVKYYLPLLGVEDGAYFALIDRGLGIVPVLVKAFHTEREPKMKSRILEVIWQHRDPAAIPVLAEALLDPAPAVWKEALNGLVALNRPECISVLEKARGRDIEGGKSSSSFISWVEEALEQLQNNRPDERDRDGG